MANSQLATLRLNILGHRDGRYLVSEIRFGQHFTVVVCRPMYSILVFGFFLIPICVLVGNVITRSTYSDLGFVLLLGGAILLAGIILMAALIAIVGPRGVRRVFPWSRWVPHEKVVEFKVGLEHNPVCVAAILMDGTGRVLLVNGDALGFFDSVPPLEDARQRIEAASAYFHSRTQEDRTQT